MESLPKFIIVSLIAVLLFGFASIAWPLITQLPRPFPLTMVYDAAITTDVGRNVEQVLGISSDTTPINIPEAGAELANMAVVAVQQKAQSIVVEQAVKQVVAQFDKLPEDQREQFRASICQPSISP